MQSGEKKIKKMVSDLKIDMLLLQETNLKDISKVVIGSLWGVADCDYLEVDAIGSAGGSLAIWNSDFFKLEAVCCNWNFILLKGTIPPNFQCIIINIYGPCSLTDRRCLCWGCFWVLSGLWAVSVGLW